MKDNDKNVWYINGKKVPKSIMIIGYIYLITALINGFFHIVKDIINFIGGLI